MANDGSTRPAFEVPAEMRAMAEKGLEQAKQAFESLLSATQNAALSAGTQLTTMQTGARETGELAMRFAERNVTSAFEFAEKLVRAKDPQEVVKLHADYGGQAGADGIAFGRSRETASTRPLGVDGQGSHGFCAVQYFLLQCIADCAKHFS